MEAYGGYMFLRGDINGDGNLTEQELDALISEENDSNAVMVRTAIY